MIENLFVLMVFFLSGAYVLQRMRRMGRASRKGEAACDSCASATCKPIESGETELPLHSN